MEIACPEAGGRDGVRVASRGKSCAPKQGDGVGKLLRMESCIQLNLFISYLSPCLKLSDSSYKGLHLGIMPRQLSYRLRILQQKCTLQLSKHNS